MFGVPPGLAVWRLYAPVYPGMGHMISLSLSLSLRRIQIIQLIESFINHSNVLSNTEFLKSFQRLSLNG